MLIGIDLDNTLIDYTDAFHHGAHELELVPYNWRGHKLELQNYICSSSGGELNWKKLQGKVYGHWINKAKLFQGAYRFLWRCRHRGWTIVVASHKTRYGHYDSEHIPLREAAKNFLKSCKVWEPDGKGMFEKLFFEETRSDKIQTIAKLQCDVFVDDLKVVLEDPRFPPQTRRILFDPANQHKSTQLERVCSWDDLIIRLLGGWNEDELIALAKSCGIPNVSKVENVCRGGNSRVFQVHTKEKNKFAVKVYPQDNSHDRLRSEFDGLHLIISKGTFPLHIPYKADRDLEVAAFEWIDGDMVKDAKMQDIGQAVGFLSHLHELRFQCEFENFSRASAACLSGEEIEQQLISRFDKLSLEKNKDLNTFLNTEFLPVEQKMLQRSKTLWPNPGFYSILKREHQTLSPSDFGFHNALRRKNGNLVFLDFEYFGWDDPVKLMCDFAYHPGMELTREMRKYWFHAALKLYGQGLQSRLNASWPLYGLCWVLILLNEFRADVWKRRYTADSAIIEFRKNLQFKQLERSRKLLKFIECSVQTKTLNFLENTF